jgi:hypothetical protein
MGRDRPHRARNGWGLDRGFAASHGGMCWAHNS